MNVLIRACAIGYEVALTLVLVLALLAPLHAGQTRHLWLVQTLDPAHALIEGDLRGVAIGDLVPLYRYKASKSPIGEARIESADGNLAQISIKPEQMTRPLGGHARVSETVAARSRNPQSTSTYFDMLKYSIWSLTIVGCLVGYGYSVVSIVWGKFIRNLDFTVTGWLTNAFCYGPMLGVVNWGMTPPVTGTRPIVTDGPLLALMLGVGFLLNVLYMLSIWNLGTMFDLMADKGGRTSLFYGVVRHPSYTLEAGMFFATNLAWLTQETQWLAVLMYFVIYWIRSEREDNFMEHSNPEYAPYQQRLPWKFIPGIY